jgi:hypothetical protein
MFEIKIAMLASMATALLAVAAAPTGDLAEMVKLGLAGLAMGIVFWMSTRTLPQLMKDNAVLLETLAKLNAEAVKEAAKVNAEADIAAAKVHADAMGQLGRTISEYSARQHDMMAEMIGRALHAQPPKQ